MPKGAELLIADSVDRDRNGLRKLFEKDGYVCSTAKSMEEARNVIQQKFFPAAVVDLDFCSLNGGLDLVRFIREKSRPTKVVLLTGRRTFEAAVESLRLGVVDIVNKQPDQVSRLNRSVKNSIDIYQAGDKDSLLLREVQTVIDAAIKIMMSMSRRIYEDESSSSGSGQAMKPTILIVDENQSFLQEIANLVLNKEWEVSIEMSGGAGLDKATTFSFQILAVCDQLTDLPGQTLIKSIQAQQPKLIGLLYSKAETGFIDRYEAGKSVASDKPFSGASHLVEKLSLVTDELATIQQERRYLRAFRNEHGDFLKRYAELKIRIDSLVK
ncbi:MAG: response regulator [Deltaproteobacteria bacterium]|nr:response regulator [Deltaproteobacteria bacterium]